MIAQMMFSCKTVFQNLLEIHIMNTDVFSEVHFAGDHLLSALEAGMIHCPRDLDAVLLVVLLQGGVVVDLQVEPQHVIVYVRGAELAPEPADVL